MDLFQQCGDYRYNYQWEKIYKKKVKQKLTSLFMITAIKGDRMKAINKAMGLYS